MINNSQKSSRAQAFVSFIVERINKDKGAAAKLRRADNPATEYQSWEQLAAFHINLENANERLPYTTIAAAMAKAKVKYNGNLGIGRALANCYADDGGNDSDQAKAKLRRLLACDTVKEACRILRPIFSLIQAKNAGDLNFAKLLDDLLKFQWDDARQRIKAQWAQNFYGSDKEAGQGEGE